MKAITVWQPWASLKATNAKQYETRSWSTTYRGPIAIHAAKKKPSSLWDAIEGIVDKVRAALGVVDLDELPRGAIIATGELVGCWEIHEDGDDVFIDKYDSKDAHGMTWISPQEYLFGNYRTGRYAWEIVNVKMLDEPVPARGKQGLWNWEDAAA